MDSGADTVPLCMVCPINNIIAFMRGGGEGLLGGETVWLGGGFVGGETVWLGGGFSWGGDGLVGGRV